MQFPARCAVVRKNKVRLYAASFTSPYSWSKAAEDGFLYNPRSDRQTVALPEIDPAAWTGGAVLPGSSGTRSSDPFQSPLCSRYEKNAGDAAVATSSF
jgi:hypothetical protein